MKKIVILLLCLTAVIGFSACSKGEDIPSTTTPQSTQEQDITSQNSETYESNETTAAEIKPDDFFDKIFQQAKNQKTVVTVNDSVVTEYKYAAYEAIHNQIKPSELMDRVIKDEATSQEMRKLGIELDASSQKRNKESLQFLDSALTEEECFARYSVQKYELLASYHDVINKIDMYYQFKIQCMRDVRDGTLAQREPTLSKMCEKYKELQVSYEAFKTPYSQLNGQLDKITEAYIDLLVSRATIVYA